MIRKGKASEQHIATQRGLTLVELITIVILLSIIAVTVVPRFFDNSGFVEFSIQQRFIAALRNIQLKALYDTRPSFCYKMILQSGSPQAFGPSTASYLNGQESNSCDSSIDFSSDAFQRTSASELGDENISLNAIDAGAAITFIEFDSLGRPYSDIGTCANGCEVSFSGEETRRICIASEGYIYACSN